MRVDRLYVTGSKTLLTAGIRSLSIEFKSDISIILGTNGCGKSLTMSYLDPAPASTTTFENWGRRDVVYQKPSGAYTVSTDYSLQTSPHQFISPDGENLNVGQTARMQEQLCESELGLDALSIGLMMNTATLVKRTEGQRKSFLMNITPMSIGFILDQQKDVERKIRDTTANITRLQERKVQLEQDLLSTTVIGQLEDEEQTHQAFLEAIQKRLWDIDRQDKADPSTLIEPSSDGLKSISNSVRFISERAREFVALGLKQEDIPAEIRRVETEIATRQGIIKSKSDQIIETRTTLSQTEQRIAELGVQAELSSMMTTIDEISKTISENSMVPLPPLMITKQELEYCQAQSRQVETALSSFLSLGNVIYSRNKLSIKKRMWTYYSRQADGMRNRLRGIPEEISELNAAQSIRTSDIPSPCSGNACPLYRGCTKKESRLNKQIMELEEETRIIQHKLGWHDKYAACYSEIISVQNDIHDKLQILWELAKTNPVLQSLLRRKDILTQLRIGPVKLYRDMMAILSQIAWSYRKTELQDELSSLHASVSRFKAAGDGDVVALEQSIRKEETRLNEQISGLEAISKESDLLSEKKTDLETWVTRFKSLDHFDDHIRGRKENALLWIKRQIREKQRLVLKEHQKERLARIGDIRKTLRDQSLLKSRYDEEVLSQLTKLEHERTVLRKVCHELTMAPREYMVPFVNSILTIVNKLIAQYWTQKIEFILWDVNEELKYQFPHSKNGNLVKDMDFGSEGERDLFTLLFNLAIRIVRGRTALPLCLDEVGRTFDEKHKQNLVRLLTHVMDQKWASQMIIVNHDPMVHEGFLHADVIVLNGENIHTPEIYNEHVEIN